MSENESSSNQRPVGDGGTIALERIIHLCDKGIAPEASNNENSSQVPTPSKSPNYRPSGTRPYPAYRSDPLAMDKPGEELFPEASVWQIYKKEATEYDNELVKGRNKNLDTMLLFAALFSAILTAFLIESTSLLQEDPADTSAALLSLLVRSQLGAINASDALLEPSSFSPTTSARWVNALWFASLALSLAAALLAMLAKEWLDAFTTSHKRVPHVFAATRQARLDGFEAWRAPHIMDLLPTLLHISLLLFSLGLVVYLWRIDQAIAVMLSVIIGVTSTLYAGTIVCGAIYELCPFVTRISRYLQIIIHRGMLDTVDNLGSSNILKNEDIMSADLQALAWLGRNARDRESSNSAYQALAGLQCRKMKVPLTIPEGGLKAIWELKEQQSISQFFQEFSLCFDSALTKSPQELARCKGENIVRYLRAFPEVMTCVGAYMRDLCGASAEQTQNCMFMQLINTVDGALKSTPMVLDKIWSGHYNLSANTYAYAASAEMRYIQTTIENDMLNSVDSPNAPETIPDSYEVRIPPDNSVTRSIEIGPAALWDRYEAALNCATILIERHLLGPSSLDEESAIHIHLPCLLDLLDTIQTTANFMWKLPRPYWQSLHDKKTTFTFKFLAPGLRSKSYQSNFSLPLLRLLRVLGNHTPLLTTQLVSACASTMYAVGMLYTKDRAGSSQTDSTKKTLGPLKTTDPVDLVFTVTMFTAKNRPSYELVILTMKALLGIVTLTSSEERLVVGTWASQLPRLIELIHDRANHWPSLAREFLLMTLATKMNTGDPTSRTCETVRGYQPNSRVTATRGPYCEHDLDPSRPIPMLLHLIQQTPDCRSEVELLLDELMEKFELVELFSERHLKGYTPDDPLVAYFTSNQGFNELAKIAQRPEYVQSVTYTIMRLCASPHFHQSKPFTLEGRLGKHSLHSKIGKKLIDEYAAVRFDSKTRVIVADSLPGFLTAVTIALRQRQTVALDVPPGGVGFIAGAMKLLNASLRVFNVELDEDSGRMAVEVVQNAFQSGGPALEKDAGSTIAQYFELPIQTEEEIVTLEDER